MDTTLDQTLRARCTSLFRFLRDLTALRTSAVYSVDDHERVVWFHEVPQAPECDSIAWRPPPPPAEDLDEAEQEDDVRHERDAVWLEVDRVLELPEAPMPPAALEHWLELDTVGDCQRESPALREAIADDGAERRLAEEPQVRKSFELWLDQRWRPWAEERRRLERVYEIYGTLFAMLQRQDKLGEDFEIVLGLGLLSWQPDDDHPRVRRHLVTAEAAIEVDGRTGRITVGPGPEGARPRLEQDMVEPSRRPAPQQVTELERLVRDIGDAIWSPDDIAEVCARWATTVAADGRWEDRMEPTPRVGPAPHVAFAPALILRKRSEQSLMGTFGEILDQLEDGAPVPFGIARYVAVLGEEPQLAAPEPGALERDYLPLPANAEQLTVVDRMRTQQGVLVQGPPGTGKSHTIANLICHLLATGQRVLVTSHTARALEVLREKLPGGFASLCVDLLGTGRDATMSLERSVQAITERHQGFDRARSAAEIEQLEQALQRAREEEAEARLALRQTQEQSSFVHRLELDGAVYEGTLMRIAWRLDAGAEALGWIQERIEQPLPLTDDELRALCAAPRDRALEARAGDDPARVAEACDAVLAAWRACDAHAAPWLAQAAHDVAAGRDRAWRARLDGTRENLEALGDGTRLDALRVAGLGERARDAVSDDASALRAHLAKGGSLGFWVFRAGIVKRTRHVWEGMQVDGRPCTTVDALDELIRFLDAERRFKAMAALWEDVADAPSGSAAIRAAHYVDLCEPLETAFALGETIAALRAAAAEPDSVAPFAWHDRDAVRALGNAARARARVERLAAASSPALADRIADPAFAGRVDSLRAAWAWRRASVFVADRLDPAREAELRRTVAARQQAQREALGALAEARAWHALLEGLDEGERQHLIAWTKAIRRIGKGTGKHAARHRRAAREHMEHCRAAIPAWILPIWRVAESIRPGVDAFDVVIVDEASQSGPEALFLLWLAKKIIVVGDDKQISPDWVGITRDDVEHLRARHLTEVPHSDAFSLEHSLFDLAEIRYGNRIRLREHFRCMPEIIRFSNDLCYRAEPLIPLKQFGAGRLTPVIETRHVPDGYRDGTGTKVFNPPEADALVDEIARCHEDPAYEGKTFGVISLQGPHQAQLIEGKLLERLGPDAVLARDLVCGDAYAFQGDERDVMFLSLVAAPHAERRIGTLADQRSERRFNVAVSRAREQLWLFHTATVEDLSPKCLRRALLEHCLDPRAKAAEPIGVDAAAMLAATARADRGRDQPPAPFDSWFELDVCAAIAGRGYRVQPQLEVAGYRIDLVVVGAARRLAVECDGDAWHGAEQWEADDARQRALERCGWTFFRVRGSAYYLDREAALEPLWEQLAARGIEPAP